MNIAQKVQQIAFDEDFNVIGTEYSPSVPLYYYRYIAHIHYNSDLPDEKVKYITIQRKDINKNVYLATIKGQDIEECSISKLKKLNKKELLEKLENDGINKKIIKKLFLRAVIIDASKIA